MANTILGKSYPIREVLDDIVWTKRYGMFRYPNHDPHDPGPDVYLSHDDKLVLSKQATDALMNTLGFRHPMAVEQRRK